MEEERVFLEKDRIPVFIGKNGETKGSIEKKFSTKIDIDSKTGEAILESEDSLNLFILSNIINAINQGHSPDSAMKLEDENYVLDVIDIKSMVRDHNRLRTVMGRIIGREGATRKAVEELTSCSISIKDNYVSFIGPFENTHIIREALEMLIKGASHKTCYSFLERNRTKMDTGLL